MHPLAHQVHPQAEQESISHFRTFFAGRMRFGGEREIFDRLLRAVTKEILATPNPGYAYVSKWNCWCNKLGGKATSDDARPRQELLGWLWPEETTLSWLQAKLLVTIIQRVLHSCTNRMLLQTSARTHFPLLVLLCGIGCRLQLATLLL